MWCVLKSFLPRVRPSPSSSPRLLAGPRSLSPQVGRRLLLLFSSFFLSPFSALYSTSALLGTNVCLQGGRRRDVDEEAAHDSPPLTPTAAMPSCAACAAPEAAAAPPFAQLEKRPAAAAAGRRQLCSFYFQSRSQERGPHSTMHHREQAHLRPTSAFLFRTCTQHLQRAKQFFSVHSRQNFPLRMHWHSSMQNADTTFARPKGSWRSTT